MTDDVPGRNQASIELETTRPATPLQIGAAVALLPPITLVVVFSLAGGMTSMLWILVGFLLLAGLTVAGVLFVLGRRQPARWRLDTAGITTVHRSGVEERVAWRDVERVTLVDRLEAAGRHSVRRRGLEFAVSGRRAVGVERMTRDPDGDVEALRSLARDVYARGWLHDEVPFTEDTPATRGR